MPLRLSFEGSGPWADATRLRKLGLGELRGLDHLCIGDDDVSKSGFEVRRAEWRALRQGSCNRSCYHTRATRVCLPLALLQDVQLLE